MRPDYLLVLGAVSLGAVAGCHRPSPPAAASAAPAAPAIAVVKPEKRPIKRVIEQPGAVQAFEETALHAKVPGYVGAVAADPDKKDRPPHDRQIDIGSRVKKDQVLAELTVPELEQEFKQKQSLVRQAAAEVVQSEKALLAAGEGVAVATAAVTEAAAGVARAQALYDFWQSEVTKFTGLVKSGVIDSQGQEATTNQFKAAEATRGEANAKVVSARAAVKKSEADRDKAAADVDAAKARLEVAKAEVERVDALRGYTKIRAPFDGVVTSRAVNTGDYVMGNGKAGLLTIARIDPVRVVVKVPEVDAGLVVSGQDIRLALQSLPGTPTTGKVVRTSWSLEPGSRTLRTEIDLANPDGLVRPGMYVYASLTVEMPAAWAVPVAAIGKINEEPVVYLSEGGKAVRVSVQLLRGDGQYTQLRRYRRPGATEWQDFTGGEQLATPASALTDGQVLSP
jgi:HlyD family secretion protein